MGAPAQAQLNVTLTTKRVTHYTKQRVQFGRLQQGRLRASVGGLPHLPKRVPHLHCPRRCPHHRPRHRVTKAPAVTSLRRLCSTSLLTSTALAAGFIAAAPTPRPACRPVLPSLSSHRRTRIASHRHPRHRATSRGRNNGWACSCCGRGRHVLFCRRLALCVAAGRWPCCANLGSEFFANLGQKPWEASRY